MYLKTLILIVVLSLYHICYQYFCRLIALAYIVYDQCLRLPHFAHHPPLASAHPTYSAAACRLAGLPSAPSPGDRFPMLSHTRSERPLTPIFFLLPQ